MDTLEASNEIYFYRDARELPITTGCRYEINLEIIISEENEWNVANGRAVDTHLIIAPLSD